MIIPFIAGILLLGILIPMFKKELGFISRNFSKEKTVKIVTVTTEEKKKDTPATETTKKVEEVKKAEPVKVIRYKPNKIQFLGLLLIVTAVILYTLYAFKYTAAWYYGWSGLSHFWLLILVILFGILVSTFTERYIFGMILIIFPIILFGSSTKRVFDVERGGTVEIEIPPPLQKSCFNSISNCNLKPYLLKVNDEEVWYKNGELPENFKKPEKLYKLTIYILENGKKKKGQVTQEFALR